MSEASAGICTGRWNSTCRLQPMCLVLPAVTVGVGGLGEGECGFPSLVCMGCPCVSYSNLEAGLARKWQGLRSRLGYEVGGQSMLVHPGKLVHVLYTRGW